MPSAHVLGRKPDSAWRTFGGSLRGIAAKVEQDRAPASYHSDCRMTDTVTRRPIRLAQSCLDGSTKTSPTRVRKRGAAEGNARGAPLGGPRAWGSNPAEPRKSAAGAGVDAEQARRRAQVDLTTGSQVNLSHASMQEPKRQRTSARKLACHRSAEEM